MFNDHFLKFTSEAQWITTNNQVAWTDENIDVVGVISIPELRADDGSLIKAAFASDGFHVNIRTLGELPDALKPFTILRPNPPFRDWS